MKTLVFFLCFVVYFVAVLRWGNWFDRQAEKIYHRKQRNLFWLARGLAWCGLKADMFTACRLLGSLTILLWIVFIGQPEALSMFQIGLPLALTDSLDGLMARYYGESAFGTLFDPIADKLLFVALSVRYIKNDLVGVALCITYVLFASSLVGFCYCKCWLEMPNTVLQETFRSNIGGKLKNIFQLVALGTLYLAEISPGSIVVLPQISLVLLFAAIPLEIRSQMSKGEKIRQYHSAQNSAEQIKQPPLRLIR